MIVFLTHFPWSSGFVRFKLKTGKKISIIKELLQNMKVMCRMKKESKIIGFFNLKMSIITTNCYLLRK